MTRLNGLCLLALFAFLPRAEAVERTALVGGTLVDGTLSDPIRDSVILIEDERVATSYAVEALRIFDHFHFRVAMREADTQRRVLKLAKPPAGGQHPWFREAFIPGHIKERDRLLFSA